MRKFLFLACLSVVICNTIFSQESGNIKKIKVGDIDVALLVETRSKGNPSIIIGADSKLLSEYLENNSFESEVNTFLVKTAENTIIIDTGFGGAIFDNMKQLGVNPEDVDIVLLTHMHGDHIGGLQKDGKALFPNATIYLSKAEKDYWTSEKIMKQQESSRQKSFINAQQALKPYGKKVKTFTPSNINSKNKEVIKGVTPIAAYGHTPGHTLYLIESKNEKLLILADMVHVMDIQIPRPDISVTYDTDPVQAAKSREEVFKYASEKNIPVSGMHLIYPGFGYLIKQGNNSYSFKTIN